MLRAKVRVARFALDGSVAVGEGLTDALHSSALINERSGEVIAERVLGVTSYVDTMGHSAVPYLVVVYVVFEEDEEEPS